MAPPHPRRCRWTALVGTRQAYNRAVLILTLWLALMGAGGLCYPRRPRTAGVLFVSAGGFMLVVWAMGAIGDQPPFIAAISAALGLGKIWQFRSPATRAAHRAEWVGIR
jgi:hypothetical protein